MTIHQPNWTSVVIPLSIQNLVKDYGDLRAVNDVSFQLEPGEIFGLLGPNGAGKTSIISTIVTLERPTAGEVEVFGHSVKKAPSLAKSEIGYVPQELINHGFFDVEEVLNFYSGYFGNWNDKERAEYLLHRLDLWDHRKKKVKALSGGMKRRLLIAKALMHKPRLLLLDEPTAGVDIELRSSLWEFVRELQQEGMTVLLTTHYLEEAEELCQRVGILQKGSLKKVGQTADLIKDFTQREIRIEYAGGSSDLSHPHLVKSEGETLLFRVPANVGLGDILQQTQLAGEKIRDVKIHEGNLEEAFRSVLGGEV